MSIKTPCPYPDCKVTLEFDDDPESVYGVEPFEEFCACDKERLLICQASILIDVQPGQEIEPEDRLAEEIPVDEEPRTIDPEAWPDEFEDLSIDWPKYRDFVQFKTASHYDCLEHACRGVFTETSELLDIFMKTRRNQEDLPTAKVIDEMGDIAFHSANVFRHLGHDWFVSDVEDQETLEDFVDEIPSKAGLFYRYYRRGEHIALAHNLGLILGICTKIITQFGFDWQDIWERNVKKLETRYKGSFTVEEVKNRDLKAELDAQENV